MREIKFRAWDGHRMHAAFDLSQNPLFWWQDNYDYPLMQYTGLKDKNGVEIYEGDILIEGLYVDLEKPHVLGFVAFGECGGGGPDEGFDTMGFYIDTRGYVEEGLLNHTTGLVVIGNIYEHPDLIK